MVRKNCRGKKEKERKKGDNRGKVYDVREMREKRKMLLIG